MNHKEKQSITHYISIRFAAIILIMAAIMILFISYFPIKQFTLISEGRSTGKAVMIFLTLKSEMGKF